MPPDGRKPASQGIADAPQPNRLRDIVRPNTLSGPRESWASWAPDKTPRRLPGGQGPAPSAAERRRLPQLPVSRRQLGRIGIWIAVAGVLPFLNAEFRWQEVGLAMEALGFGIALLASAMPAALAVGAGLPAGGSGSGVGSGGRRRARAAISTALGALLLALAAVLLLDAIGIFPAMP